MNYWELKELARKVDRSKGKERERLLEKLIEETPEARSLRGALRVCGQGSEDAGEGEVVPLREILMKKDGWLFENIIFDITNKASIH